MYEKTITVSSNLKIQVNFVEVSEETTGETVPETETQLIAETENEPQTEKEPDTEISPESEIDESRMVSYQRKNGNRRYSCPGKWKMPLRQMSVS